MLSCTAVGNPSRGRAPRRQLGFRGPARFAPPREPSYWGCGVMSVYKNKNGKTVRRAIIPKGEQWTWWTIEMIESPAYRVLSLSGHRVVARIRLELARHGGNDNGKLPVTFDDFHEY
jgi:hypothetical protein